MLEDQLKTQLKDPTRAVVMLQCGIHGHGKTTKMCSILRWCLDNDACSEYWLIAPSFSRHANSGYNWLKQPKYRKVRVLTDYTPLLSEYLYKRKKSPEKGTLLWEGGGPAVPTRLADRRPSPTLLFLGLF